MIRRFMAPSAAFFAALLICQPLAPARADDLSSDEVRAIAREAYIYAYPMVLTDITMRVGTNVAEPAGLRAPLNQIAHARAFPDGVYRRSAPRMPIRSTR